MILELDTKETEDDREGKDGRDRFYTELIADLPKLSEVLHIIIHDAPQRGAETFGFHHGCLHCKRVDGTDAEMPCKSVQYAIKGAVAYWHTGGRTRSPRPEMLNSSGEASLMPKASVACLRFFTVRALTRSNQLSRLLLGIR